MLSRVKRQLFDSISLDQETRKWFYKKIQINQSSNNWNKFYSYQFWLKLTEEQLYIRFKLLI